MRLRSACAGDSAEFLPSRIDVDELRVRIQDCQFGEVQ